MTNLECNQPDTLNSITNDQEILDCLQRSHIDSNVKKCHTN